MDQVGKKLLLFFTLLKLCILPIFSFFLASCGSYTWQNKISLRAISVPFIKNDSDGMLTTALIETLGKSGFTLDKRADRVLEVELIEVQAVSVGYNYGYDERARPTADLKATEARVQWTCAVAIKDRESGEYLEKPHKLSVEVDFDFQSDEMPNNDVQFSVSQLNIREEAQTFSQLALKRKMASAISSWLLMHWPQ